MAFDFSDFFLQIKFPIQCYNIAFRKLSTWNDNLKPSWGKQKLNEYVCEVKTSLYGKHMIKASLFGYLGYLGYIFQGKSGE